MKITPEEIIEQNWKEVKNEMRKTWNKLTEDQVGEINNYEDLVKQLKKAYDITDDEKIIEKINNFIEKFDLQPNLTTLEKFKNSLYEEASEAGKKVQEAIKTSAETVYDKTGDLAKQAVAYSKENPLKVVGLGVLAAVAIKKLLEKK